MKHSQKIEETKLWHVYSEKVGDDYARITWTKKVSEAAFNYLKAVRDTFDNYTLHDQTHVLNVLDAMSGLLGNQIDNLTVGEAELLILSAAIHDVGMVYTEADRKKALHEKTRLTEYCSTHPNVQDSESDEWGDDIQQNYLRWLHPFRVEDVLQKSEWRELFEGRPKDIVSEKVIIAVCKSHGESPETIRLEATETNGILKYSSFKEVDSLFCAIILRLADILDFDDSRTPSVLFSYSGRSEKSVEEWRKHMGSMGFNYPEDPSIDDLPYGASFDEPAIEQSARVFLDWIDEELSNSRKLLPFTCGRWKTFPFPYQIDRSGIERSGYDFGDFKISMDQNSILDLLIGEKLYRDRSVFVRELLQNSIDATLLRAEMDTAFAEKINSDEARIDLWEWWDDAGDLWFRIDDRGTGMTRGMLEKYFLKAGSSYYNSQEIKKDLKGKRFSSIGRFGIGFLSCFLCGMDAYVSTTYWNPEKNIKEAERDKEIRIERKAFGLRLDVTGITGYFTLRNQTIIDNNPNPLPSSPEMLLCCNTNYEKDGYRTMPGTSIAIRIDSRKLGAQSLEDVARLWVCFPRMPVYYNGKRLESTQDELIALVKKEQGINEYELSDNDKLKFDAFAPDYKGNYPIIRESIKYVETEQVPWLPKLKLLFSETKVIVPDKEMSPDRQQYHIYYDDSHFNCPKIGSYVPGDAKSTRNLEFALKDTRLLFEKLMDARYFGRFRYGWKGIVAPRHFSGFHGDRFKIIIIDENEEGPEFKASRVGTASLNLKVEVSILAYVEKNFHYRLNTYSKGRSETLLKEWRAFYTPEYRKWIDITSWKDYDTFMGALERGIGLDEAPPKVLEGHSSVISPLFWEDTNDLDIRMLFLAHLQLNHRIVVDYSNHRLTHNHPEGVKGAESIAAAIFLLRKGGKSKEDVKRYIVSEFGYDLSRTCDEIRPGYHHVESCQETVPEAITAFMEGENFEDCIRTAVSLGGDCDTLTCITGALAEAFYGVPQDLMKECRERVPEEMVEILDAFDWRDRGFYQRSNL